MAAKPITPQEVILLKTSTIPDAIFEAFNELIAENFNGHTSSFTEKKVVARIVQKGISSKTAYDNNWLDVETLYQKAGWKVEYDKPGYNESYEAYFSFSRKTKS
jgi:hypothetical protein